MAASRQFTATFTAPINDPPKRKSKYAIPFAVQEGDAVADADPVSAGRLCHAARGTELLAPGAPLAPEHQHLVVGLSAREVPDHSGDRVAILFGDGDVP